MTKTDDEMIKECYERRYGRQKYKGSVLFHTYGVLIKDILSLKQNQQDELLNKFNEKVDEEIDKHNPKKFALSCDKQWAKDYNQTLEKSKQLAKEVFGK